MKIFLVRAGTDAGTNAGKLSDERLTLQGEEEARAVGKILQKETFTKFYTSPAQRAMQSSNLISSAISKEFTVDQRLRDRDLGQAKDLDYKEVEKRFGSLLKENRFDKNWAFPDGEKNIDIFNRVLDLVREIEVTATGISEQILIVSHPSVLNYLIFVMQNLGFQEGLFYRFEPGMIAELQREGNFYHLHSLYKPNIMIMS